MYPPVGSDVRLLPRTGHMSCPDVRPHRTKSHMANAQNFGVFGNYLAMERRDADAGADAGRALPSSETERTEASHDKG